MPPLQHGTEARLSRPCLDNRGLRALGERWRELETRAAGSFFQSWTWVGCMAAHRFTRPVLIEAFCGAELVALALLNRRPRLLTPQLWLHESGDAALDAVFTEHNGPLIMRDAGDAVLDRVLSAALGPGSHQVLLSGCGPAVLSAAQRVSGAMLLEVLQTREAPYVEMSAIPETAGYIDQLSRNTRQQLRRSDRAYGAVGPLDVSRAATAPEALEWFAQLVRLHDATWHARGKPGAFANPAVHRFHRELIERGVPRHEVDLLRVRAGPDIVGYLYNFVCNGEVSAYQSGFNYADAGPHQKPGLTCHRLAIDRYRAAGASRYDFLAGASRYKASFANGTRPLHWLSLTPRWRPRGIQVRLRRLLGHG